jgi:hypothetical protein
VKEDRESGTTAGLRQELAVKMRRTK